MEGSCKLGAVTTALVEGADTAVAPFGTASSLSNRDTACKVLLRYRRSPELWWRTMVAQTVGRI